MAVGPYIFVVGESLHLSQKVITAPDRTIELLVGVNVSEIDAIVMSHA